MSKYQCPECKSKEYIYLDATVETTVATDQSGEPQIEEVDKDSFFDVDDKGNASCGKCAYTGITSTFKVKE